MRDWEAEDPIVIERGEGSYLIDTDGNRYLDGVASVFTGTVIPTSTKRSKKQIDRLEHSTLSGRASDRSILLAKRLIEITPQKALHRILWPFQKD